MAEKREKIFAIGASGLVGSRIVELLGATYTIHNLDISGGIDITKPETLDIIKHDTEHPIVIHLAAKTDVDGCETDKALGKNGAAYQVNVLGTQHVVDACKKTQKKLIYISTDFVFDGEHTTPGGYTEEDIPNPINWYSKTKFLGEEIVKNSGLPFLILRLAYPYRKEFPLKKDFVRAIRERLQSNQQVLAITDHIMTPTFIDDFVSCIAVLIRHDKTGIYHTVGSECISPYDAAMVIAEVFGCDKKLISKTTRAEFFKNRAPRPFNSALNNGKIGKLGIRMRGLEEGLTEMRGEK